MPAVLVRAGCLVGDGAAPETVAAETVHWLRDALPRLPAEVLEVTLPDPGVILRTWPLGARTRGALARLGTPGRARKLRVRDLVVAERFGAAALVDLLAALEENQGLSERGPAGLAPAPASRLDELSALISTQLPLRPEELGELLVARGLSTEPLSVEEVVKLFRAWEAPIPFRVVRRAGARVLVAPKSLGAAEAIVSAATQTIVRCGLAAVSDVVYRGRSHAATGLGEGAAARVLATVPGFRWLDATSGWFSFAQTNSGVTDALAKIFAVAERVSFPELVRALAKVAPALATAPEPALERYLKEIAGYELHDGWVEPGARFAPAALGRAEEVIVGLLRDGRRLGRAALRAMAVAAGVPATTFRQLVRKSPFLVADVRGLRLLGLGARAAAAPIAA